MIPLKNEKKKLYLKQNFCHICKIYSLLMANMIFIMMLVKITVKIETTVITLENVGVPLITFEILDTKQQKKFCDIS